MARRVKVDLDSGIDYAGIRSVRRRRSAGQVFVKEVPLSKIDGICGERKDAYAVSSPRSQWRSYWEKF